MVLGEQPLVHNSIVVGVHHGVSIHDHVYVYDNDTHDDKHDGDNVYVLDRDLDVCVLLLRDLIGAGLTLTMSIREFSLVSKQMDLSVVFLVQPLSLVSLVKYLPASFTATLKSSDLEL